MPRKKASEIAAPAETPSQPAIAPTPPSPAVLELQGDIVALVRERSSFRKQVTQAQSELFAAQAKFQATESSLRQFEQEIQERISLIAQLENRAPSNVVSITNPVPGPQYGSPDLRGVSSAPARAADPGDMINRSRITSRDLNAPDFQTRSIL